MRSWILVLSLGCGSSAGGQPGPGGGVDTHPTAGTSIVSVACALQDDNALRFDCVIVREAPGPVTLTVAGRDFRSEADHTEHTLALWGFRADTDYDYVVTAGGRDATHCPCLKSFERFRIIVFPC